MSTFRQFIFESYKFDETSKVLTLNYAIDDALHFTETYRFDFPFAQYDRAVLDRALQLVFFLAGVSYFKTFVPPEIVVKAGEIDESIAAFLTKTYQRGLGEFWYVNNLDPNTSVVFPITTQQTLNVLSNRGEGLLVGIGGGKDSLVSIELLRKNRSDMTTWSLNHRSQLEPLVERIGLPHAWVERTWDSSLKELAKSGAYNGHIPISAIFASVGVVVAILTGKQDVIVSNEQSASEPTLTYRGIAINHQYSKSIEFEHDFQNYLKTNFGESLRYYSFLRPLSEVKIAELFATHAMQSYKDVFSSCNRAYVHGSNHMFWCSECPKCAFTFLILAPFVERTELEALFAGKNLLFDPGLEQTYRQLLGIEGDKPFECVGEIKESRAAMQLAKSKYPDIEKYTFELPKDYDFRALGTHSMPTEMYEILLNAVQPG